MAIDLNSPQIRFLLDAVQLGAELSCRVRAETAVRAMAKHDNSPVTVADMGIQAIAGALLERYFRGACLVAEENSEMLRRPEGQADLQEVTARVRHFFPDATPEEICRWIDHGTGTPEKAFWILDPVDGTKGFLRGGQYATALAFINGGKIEVSALGCPALELPGHPKLGTGVMLVAAKGKGCWAASLKDRDHWERLQVSPCRDVTQARVLDSFDPGHKNTDKNSFIKTALGIRTEPVFLDSQAKHAMLAAGEAEIFFRTISKRDPLRREMIWDVAPGAFAIEEAGGRVTDLSGNPMDYSTGSVLERNPGFVATNGKFHDSVLKAIGEAGGAL